MISLSVIFSSMSVNFIQTIITSNFYGQKLKLDHYITSLESLNIAL